MVAGESSVLDDCLVKLGLCEGLDGLNPIFTLLGDFDLSDPISN